MWRTGLGVFLLVLGIAACGDGTTQGTGSLVAAGRNLPDPIPLALASEQDSVLVLKTAGTCGSGCVAQDSVVTHLLNPMGNPAVTGNVLQITSAPGFEPANYVAIEIRSRESDPGGAPVSLPAPLLARQSPPGESASVAYASARLIDGKWTQQNAAVRLVDDALVAPSQRVWEMQITETGTWCLVRAGDAPSAPGDEPSLTISGPDGAPQTGSALDLGLVVAGREPAELTLFVHNPAQVARTLQARLAGASSAFSVSSPCSTVAPGQTCPVSVRFAPASGELGPAASLLVIGDEAISKPFQANLIAESGPPLLISPEDGITDFGARVVGAVVPQPLTFNVQYRPSEPAPADRVPAKFGPLHTTLFGDDAFRVVESSCDGAQLAWGAGCTVVVDFAPGSAGRFTSALELASLRQPRVGDLQPVLAGTGLPSGTTAWVRPVGPERINFPAGAAFVNIAFQITNLAAGDPAPFAFQFEASQGMVDFGGGIDSCARGVPSGQSCVFGSSFYAQGTEPVTVSLVATLAEVEVGRGSLLVTFLP